MVSMLSTPNPSASLPKRLPVVCSGTWDRVARMELSFPWPLQSMTLPPFNVGPSERDDPVWDSILGFVPSALIAIRRVKPVRTPKAVVSP